MTRLSKIFCHKNAVNSCKASYTHRDSRIGLLPILESRCVYLRALWDKKDEFFHSIKELARISHKHLEKLAHLSGHLRPQIFLEKVYKAFLRKFVDNLTRQSARSFCRVCEKCGLGSRSVMGIKFFLSIHKKKYCLLRVEKGRMAIEQIADLAENVKLLDILDGKHGEVVTGLPSEEVILRHLTLKFHSRREILAALPFQVENILPYPSEEIILLPTLYPQKDQTEVSLLATSKTALSHHLEKEEDPDIVSCVPLALYRYARHFFPDKPSLFLQHENTFLVIEEGKLRAFQTLPSHDGKRVLALMQKKYPHIPAEPIEQGKHWEFAVPIGLALDAAKAEERSGQFRQNDNISKTHREKRKKLLTHFYAACGCFVFLTLVLGHFHLKQKEHAALQALDYPLNVHLSTAVQELGSSLYTQKKETISVPTLPKVSEILTWLSTHSKLKDDCSISRIRYQLVNSPRMGTRVKTYSAKIEIELTTQNPLAAKSFHQALLHDTEIVDKKNDVKWTADHGIYRAIFHVKPQKL